MSVTNYRSIWAFIGMLTGGTFGKPVVRIGTGPIDTDYFARIASTLNHVGGTLLRDHFQLAG
jgi:hypothetical protein